MLMLNGLLLGGERRPRGRRSPRTLTSKFQTAKSFIVGGIWLFGGWGFNTCTCHHDVVYGVQCLHAVNE